MTGWAQPENSFHAYDTETSAWGFNAAWRVVGHGATKEEALADYDLELDKYNLSLEECAR